MSVSVTYLVVALLVVLSAIPLWTAWRHRTYLNDDTYITLTYAKNLAAGRGFVYNHPPATLGTTTPLLTLIVAALSVLLPGIELATLAVFLTALCWIGTVWTFGCFRQVWNLKVWQLLCLGVIVVSQGWIAFLGMEAYLFAWLLVLSFSLFYGGHHFWAGLVSGLLFLTRGEGVLVTGLLGGYLILAVFRQSDRRVRRGSLISLLHLCIGFALPVTAWVLYAWRTFGAILPNTLAAKQAQGLSMAPTQFLTRLVVEWIPSWGAKLAFAGHSVTFLWWMLLGLGLVTVVVERRRWLLFLAWILLYVTGYSLLGVSPYWWYQLPVHFVAQLLVGLGLAKGIGLVSRIRLWRNRSTGPVLAVVLFVLISFAFLSPIIRDISNYKGDPRAQAYLRLSEWVRDHTSPEDSIGYVEIGYLGYYTPNRIIDLLGLVMPDNVSYVAEGNIAGAFWRHPPDYYVYQPDADWLVAGIRQSPEFHRQYQPIDSLPNPSGSEIVIYKRVAAAPGGSPMHTPTGPR